MFDLHNDPDELTDLGTDPAHAGVRAELSEMLLERLLSRRNRITMDEAEIDRRIAMEGELGIVIGQW